MQYRPPRPIRRSFDKGEILGFVHMQPTPMTATSGCSSNLVLLLA